MTLIAVALFLLGFAASWIAGRYVATGAAAVQGGAIGICGVAALLFGMPQVWEDNLIWALIALLIYGLVGAVIFRSGQAARERAE
jgi:dolichol kinase